MGDESESVGSGYPLPIDIDLQKEGTVSDAWVDFNDVHDGQTTTLLKFVEAGVDIRPGSKLIVGDYDHNLCDATVRSVDGSVVHLDLDLDSFRTAPDRTAASKT